ncbi:MAG: hypothetical protein JRI25_15215, partial [Deltaproteobacteria bacterium]|nr:hypothetical protein [Deltaproteobacteria bacterium]
GPRLFEDVPVLILSTMALDRKRFEAFLEQRLGLLPADLPEPVLDLIVPMLDFDPRRRPTAAEVMARCEDLGEAVAGDTLARWCRERPWPEGAMEPGALDGRLITEGTLTRSGVIASMDSADAITQRDGDGSPETSAASLALERPTGGAGPRLWLALGGVGVAVVVALLVVVGGVAGGWALGWFDGAPTAPTVGEGAAVEEVGEPVERVVETVEPAVVTEPGAGEPIVAGSGTNTEEATHQPPADAGTSEDPTTLPPAAVIPTEPAVVSPPAEPTPVTIRRRTGRVELEGTVVAQLVRDGERHALPADVPPGTYRIEGMFNGRDFEESGSITVEANATRTVVCRARMMLCNVK